MEKEIKIQVPDGYEIDTEKSTFEQIVFKEIKNPVTYLTISKTLFGDKLHNEVYSIGNNCNIVSYTGGFSENRNAILPTNSKTKKQLESILALNKLCNVAKYLNGDWLPRLGEEKHFYHDIDRDGKVYCSNLWCKGGLGISGKVYFKTEELTKQALEILGEEEIRKALTLNH